ncbi:MAG: ABC transporter ATP-binding protein [Chlorobium sp.]|nr:MAG: ABC transporter ATP-binding protein [Chlorobium sp.]
MGRMGASHAHREVQRPQKTRETLLRIWFYLRRQKISLFLTALMVVGTVCLDLVGPILLGEVIDRHIVTRNLTGLSRLLLLMLLVYVSSGALYLLQSHVMAGAAQRTMRDLREDLFSKLLHLPLNFFDRRIQGELMSRLTSDVENINQVLSNSVTQIVSGSLSTVGVAIAMFCINPILAAISVLTISLLTILSNRWLAAQTRTRFRQQQASLGRLYGFIEETIGVQKVVKAYGQENAFTAKFDRVNEEFRLAAIRAQSFSGLTGPMMNAIHNAAYAIVAGAGGIMAVLGMSTVGVIAMFISYTRQFGRPLNEIANLYNLLQSALAGAERVFEIIDEIPEVDAHHVTALRKIRGDIIFEAVSFSYRDGVPVLKEVSLHARPGQTIALIGPTGAGKTTIVNLLTRFYETGSGKILVDGRDIREIPKVELRRQLGIVLQDTFLFSGTVRENIRYGRLDATDEEIREAARLSNADTFIHQLPLGYDTILSERGSNFSHGQRQMLSIARTILADPAILILDEATSSVDTRTEKHIQEAMHRLMEGRTSFVIAHRLSTIRGADQILVINHGEVTERGTHAELLEQKGFYWRISSNSGKKSRQHKTAVPEEACPEFIAL